MARFLLWFLAITAAVLALAGWFLWSHLDLEPYDAMWREELFDGLEPLERFPPREINEAAREVERLGTSLGVDFTLANRPDLPAPDPEAMSRFEAMNHEIPEWFDAISGTDALAIPLPEAVGSYLDLAGETLGELERTLIDGELPVWSLDFSRGLEMPIPNLLAQLRLHRLLTVRALHFQEEGATAAADRALEAAWRLRRGAMESPIMISQLITQSQLGNELRVLRRSCAPPERWLGRLAEERFEERALDAMQLEAWVFRNDFGPLRAPGSLAQLGAVGYAKSMKRAVDLLREADPRTFDNEKFFAEARDRIPRWNFVARTLLPNLFDTWLKAVRVEMGAELTLAILRERLEPGSTPARVAANGVPDLHWSVRREGGEVRFALEEPVAQSTSRDLPLDYTLRPDHCAPAVGD